MNFYHLEDFKEEINLLELFFTEFAGREEEILTRGMKRVSTWESYERAVPHLKDF